MSILNGISPLTVYRYYNYSFSYQYNMAHIISTLTRKATHDFLITDIDDQISCIQVIPFKLPINIFQITPTRVKTSCNVSSAIDHCVHGRGPSKVPVLPRLFITHTCQAYLIFMCQPTMRKTTAPLLHPWAGDQL